MALSNVLILRCLAKRGLEGRTVLLQPTRNSFTASEERSTGARLEGCDAALTRVFPHPARSISALCDQVCRYGHSVFEKDFDASFSGRNLEGPHQAIA